MACLWIFCIAVGLFGNHDSKGPSASPAHGPKHLPSPMPSDSYVYALYKPPMLAQEIAVGVSMELSQVRIMGANAASGEAEKTAVLINLVPRGQKFDNITALTTFQKF